ncbi:MAG: SCO family protein [Alphaproteobacteria bacterium]|nr:SCO family protein [Alphaproteobacteria bacterium]
MKRRSFLALSFLSAVTALSGCDDSNRPPQGLINHYGEKVSGPTIKSEGYTLLFFGFTSCPLICPSGLSDINRVMSKLSPEIAAQITPVFLSVDPVHDTSETLAAFIQRFDRRIIGITGDRASIDAVVKYYNADYSLNPDGTVLSHSSFTVLLDPKGAVLKTFAFGFLPDETAQAITAIIHQQSSLRRPGLG